MAKDVILGFAIVTRQRSCGGAGNQKPPTQPVGFEPLHSKGLTNDNEFNPTDKR